NHPNDDAAGKAAIIDTDGHGSHVAGIIAGETRARKKPANETGARDKPVGAANAEESGEPPGKDANEDGELTIWVSRQQHDQPDEAKPYAGPILGLAPCCKLVSLKVMKSRDQGSLSKILAALGYLQRLNDYGRNLRVHGVNLSLGYSFEPDWFAAGQSPL